MVKRKRPFRANRAAIDARAADREHAAAQFDQVRAAAAPLVQEASVQLAGLCALGFPVVHTSTRHVTLELARDWTWSVRMQGASAALDIIQAGAPPPIEPPTGSERNPDPIGASLSSFVEAFRVREQEVAQ